MQRPGGFGAFGKLHLQSFLGAEVGGNQDRKGQARVLDLGSGPGSAVAGKSASLCRGSVASSVK